MDKLTRDGVSLSFADVGRGAPPILLIHDLGRDHTTLRPQREHLRRRHRVVAVDLLGHGQSDPLPRAYTLSCFADDLAWLCFELGVYRPVAVGHGIGGLIAVALAAGYPDLLAAVLALDASLLSVAGGSVRGGVAPIQTTAHSAGTRRLPGLVVSATNDGENGPAHEKERRGEAIATTPHLAATWQNALAWDGTPALAQCNVPVLYVTGRTPGNGTHTLRKFCSHIVVEAIRPGYLDQGAAAQRVNAMIEAFLLRHSA